MLSRGKLKKREYIDINKKLPDITGLYDSVLPLAPDFISMNFSPESTVPLAAVCLRNALDTLMMARFALQEAYAHRIWYQNYADKSREWVGISYTLFFADDVALRFYSAGEHLASAIIFMLEISKTDLDKYRKNNRISKQVILGKYLINELPSESITTEVKRLVNSKEWLKTLKYRSDWVHNQPPTVEGLGIIYNRGNRWETENGYRQLSFGAGDKPQFTIDEILSFIQGASIPFADVLRNVVEIYINTLKKSGITLDNDGKLSVTLFKRS